MAAGTAHTIARDRLGTWVESLIDEFEVVAPMTAEDGEAMFGPVSSAVEVLWSFGNTLFPPKEFVLPQTELLLSVSRSRSGVQLSTRRPGRRRLLLNLRSCDATGLRFLRKVAEADLPDCYTLDNLANTAVVSLACTSPCTDGFCVCSGAGPFLAEGFDVQLTDLGNVVLAESGSSRGDELLATGGSLFAPATAADLERRSAAEEEARRRFGEKTCHFASAMRRVSTGRVAAELWEQMSPWCLECGACTMLCPTCTCFSVKDRPCEGGWERCRTWDSCQYRAFTLEASGHNPRERRSTRMRRRFFHKVSAQYYQRDGMVGCVGCGRCVRACLGTTDMPAVVTAIRQGEWHG